ncbi:MAG: hypothetical protein EHM58_19840 [Ignavibacteriae bacterium]|nr:MAG: hypothetical protein EHM58_19840 [Ignavibacteriota bacterium]
MINHTFIDFLKSLSKDEVHKFRDFIISPYFNKKDRLIKFFDVVIKFYPAFDDASFTKECLYHKIYPDKTYHDSTIRDTLSDLFSLSKEFFIQKNITNNKAEAADALLNEYVNRNLKRPFDNSISELEKELNEEGIDGIYFLRKYKLKGNKYNFSEINLRFTKINKVLEQFESVKTTELYFLFYFIMDFVHDYINVFTYSMNYNIGQKVNVYDEVVNTIDIEKIYSVIKGKNEYDYILELYLTLMQTFRNFECEENYQNYKLCLSKVSKKLSRNELTFHYKNLMVFCFLKKKVYNQAEKYDAELFEIYKIVLKGGYYRNSSTEKLSKTLYLNILHLAIRLKEYDWVRMFIKIYSTELHEKDMENMANYSNVYLFNALGYYVKALEYINKMNLDYYIYKYDMYNLKLRIYYELGYYEPALDLIHTYRQYIREDKIMERAKKVNNTNYLKYIEQLFLFKLGKESIDINLVRMKIQKTENLIQKKWLIDKIDFDCK